MRLCTPIFDAMNPPKVSFFIMFSVIECRLHFENRHVKSQYIKGGVRKHPLPLIGVAKSLPLIGLSTPKYP